MDAVTRGTLQGVELLINIVAMLIVLVALVHLVNSLLGLFPDLGERPITLERILGFVMANVAGLLATAIFRSNEVVRLDGLRHSLASKVP